MHPDTCAWLRCPDCKHTFLDPIHPDSPAKIDSGDQIDCPSCGRRHFHVFYISLLGPTAETACA